MDAVLSDIDLLKNILQPTNITSGQQYKAIVATCHQWYDLTSSPQNAYKHMDVPSTLFTQNRDLEWNVHKMSHLLSMDVLLPYCEYYEPSKFCNQRVNFWFHLSKNPKLTRDIILKYKSLLTIESLVYLPIFNEIVEDFIAEEYRNYWNIASIDVLNKLISYYQHENKESLIPWDRITHNRNITDEFIQQHESNLHLQQLTQNRNISYYTLMKYNRDINRISLNYNLPPEYIIEFKDKLNWYYLSSNRALTLNLIIKLIDYINWDRIWLSHNITSEFIREHIAQVEWRHLSWNICVPIDIIHDFGDKISWDTFQFMRKLPLDTVIKYANVIEWVPFLQNKNVTIAFLQANIARFKGVLYD